MPSFRDLGGPSDAGVSVSPLAMMVAIFSWMAVCRQDRQKHEAFSSGVKILG